MFAQNQRVLLCAVGFLFMIFFGIDFWVEAFTWAFSSLVGNFSTELPRAMGSCSGRAGVICL